MLGEFKNEFAHTNPKLNFTVDDDYRGDGFALGQWLSNLRSRKHIQNNDLINELSGLGVSWRPENDNWNRGYEALKEFFSENGDVTTQNK